MTGAGGPPPGPEAGLTRRRFLIAGSVVVAAGVTLGAVGWRSYRVKDAWYRLTGAYGESGTPPPAYDVALRSGSLASRRLVEPAHWAVAYPPGVSPDDAAALRALPVCIALPGRGRTPVECLTGGLHFAGFVADGIEKRGVTPFAVAAVQGSDTYWHRRAAGDDAMAMLSGEFLPHLRRDLGIGGPAALIGWSMGGYGALRAAELQPELFRGVCGASAALWRSWEAGPGDAFDSAADYAANDVFAATGKLAGMPVRIDCGLQDSFYDADRAFAEALPHAAYGGFSPGGHNDAYWTRVAPDEVDFLGAALSGTLPAAPVG